jgi:hypothetical protein
MNFIASFLVDDDDHDDDDDDDDEGGGAEGGFLWVINLWKCSLLISPSQ